MSQLKDLLTKENIIVSLKGLDKEAILKELASSFTAAGFATSEEQLFQKLKDREEIDPTVVDENVAIPHAKCGCIKKAGILIGIAERPIVWDQDTNSGVQLFFMIGVPESSNDLHVEILGMLSGIISDEEIVSKLLKAKTQEEILDLVGRVEAKKEDITADEGIFDIVGVTACPTGIAHTYMAADALRNESEKQGMRIKVETNGSDGVKHMLTAEQIGQAKVVIVAADREIDLSRFDRKKVYFTSAGNTVRHAEDVLKKALQPNVPVFRFSDSAKLESSNSKGSGIYGQLMTGVSYMLPFVVGGGILIALGFMFGITSMDPNAADYHPFAQFLNTLGGQGAFALMVPVMAGYIGFGIAERPALMPAMVGGYLAANNGGGFLGGLLAGFIGGYVIVALKKVFSFLPKQFEGLKPVLFYPVFGLLFMGMILMPILGYVVAINGQVSTFLNSLSTGNLILLGVLLGGMMAVDMGGPVNKAAFTFGIAALEAGNNFPHAAVMAGGMVPPLGMALATTLFKNKFTLTERESGFACYALGASFITESAIPFAVSDPMRVLPACIIGAALAGGFSMAFGCELPAPHGGIFVFPLVKHVWFYALSIFVGSLATALIFGLSKKKA